MSNSNPKGAKKNATAQAKQKSYEATGGGPVDAKQLLERARRALKDSKTKQNESAIQDAFKLLSEACNRDGTLSDAFHLRGMCYNQMGEFQRALYDFSVAIRVEDDNKADPKKLGDYYSKSFTKFSCIF